MNCKFCSTELPEEVTLCPACGKENMEEIPAEEIPTEENSAEEIPAEEVSPKPKRSLWVTILAVVGAIAL